MRPRVFPAEDPGPVGVHGRPTPRFNEAAGIPRGRLRLNMPVSFLPCCASMRPRVFPAEDDSEWTPGVSTEKASMRPRVFPAEDEQANLARADEQAASMRPRVFPAEDMADELFSHGRRLLQ